MINILVVSDITLYKEALSGFLEEQNAVSVVGSASSAIEAFDEVSQSEADVVLIDMTMPESLEVAEKIVATFPQIKIVALLLVENEESIFSCARVGITGYVTREASLEQLINTVLNVANGELYCPRRIAASLFFKLNTLKKADDTLDNGEKDVEMSTIQASLTNREKQISQLIVEGFSNKLIARKLTIEVSTVKNHVHNILSKTGFQKRTQLVGLFS